MFAGTVLLASVSSVCVCFLGWVVHCIFLLQLAVSCCCVINRALVFQLLAVVSCICWLLVAPSCCFWMNVAFCCVSCFFCELLVVCSCSSLMCVASSCLLLHFPNSCFIFTYVRADACDSLSIVCGVCCCFLCLLCRLCFSDCVCVSFGMSPCLASSCWCASSCAGC